MIITAFKLPKSPFTEVRYMRDSVLVKTTIKTPCNQSGLQIALLAKQVGMSQVRAVCSAPGFYPIELK